jgi:hypothetical protein
MCILEKFYRVIFCFLVLIGQYLSRNWLLNLAKHMKEIINSNVFIFHQTLISQLCQVFLFLHILHLLFISYLCIYSPIFFFNFLFPMLLQFYCKYIWLFFFQILAIISPFSFYLHIYFLILYKSQPKYLSTKSFLFHVIHLHVRSLIKN